MRQWNIRRKRRTLTFIPLISAKENVGFRRKTHVSLQFYTHTHCFPLIDPFMFKGSTLFCCMYLVEEVMWPPGRLQRCSAWPSGHNCQVTSRELWATHSLLSLRFGNIFNDTQTILRKKKTTKSKIFKKGIKSYNKKGYDEHETYGKTQHLIKINPAY